MINITDEEFENLVSEAWKNIPAHFKFEMKNVAIRIESEPTPEQMQRAHVRGGTLLGLFDGIAKPQWGQAMTGDQPSKISIFQNTIVRNTNSINELKNLVQEVLMHEIAHYFGYNDEEMCILDKKLRNKLRNL